MFLLRDISQFAYDQSEESQEVPEDLLPSYQQSAIWCIAVSLAIILLFMTFMALLDKPLDPPGTLRVNNRYVRLAPRIIYITVILSVPAKHDIDPSLFLGIASIMMILVTSWEWSVSLEKGGGLFEPKSLAVMVARDKQKRGQNEEMKPLFFGRVGLSTDTERRN